MNNIITKALNVLLLLVIVVMLFKSCQFKKEHDDLLAQMSAYKQGEKVFEVKRQKDSSTIATQSQTILTQKEAIRLGQIKLDGEIKKAQSQTYQSQKVSIKYVDVPFIPDGYDDTASWKKRFANGDTSKQICDSVLNNSVIVPKRFETDTKWYGISGKVTKSGISIDSMTVNNESTVTIGYKKGGFLNLKKIPIVEIKNTNPYLSVTKMNNVVIKPNDGILQKKGFWFALGCAVIYLLK